MKLMYHGTNNGFCRVYYRNADKKDKTLYAFQLEDFRNNLFRLYVCSRDGEPSFEKYRWNCDVQLSKGEESTDIELNTFLKEHHTTHFE